MAKIWPKWQTGQLSPLNDAQREFFFEPSESDSELTDSDLKELCLLPCHVEIYRSNLCNKIEDPWAKKFYGAESFKQLNKVQQQGIYDKLNEKEIFPYVMACLNPEQYQGGRERRRQRRTRAYLDERRRKRFFYKMKALGDKDALRSSRQHAKSRTSSKTQSFNDGNKIDDSVNNIQSSSRALNKSKTSVKRTVRFNASIASASSVNQSTEDAPQSPRQHAKSRTSSKTQSFNDGNKIDDSVTNIQSSFRALNKSKTSVKRTVRFNRSTSSSFNTLIEKSFLSIDTSEEENGGVRFNYQSTQEQTIIEISDSESEPPLIFPTVTSPPIQHAECEDFDVIPLPCNIVFGTPGSSQPQDQSQALPQSQQNYSEFENDNLVCSTQNK